MLPHLRHPLPQPDGEHDANHRRERDGEGGEPIAEHCVSHAYFDTSTTVSGEKRGDALGLGADMRGKDGSGPAGSARVDGGWTHPPISNSHAPMCADLAL